MIEKLVWMKGMTLSTLARDKKFTILDVFDTAVFIKIHSTGKIRSISKTEIDWAWNELKTNKILTQQQIYDTESRNSPFTATILARLPGVSHRVKPITFYYKEL